MKMAVTGYDPLTVGFFVVLIIHSQTMPGARIFQIVTINQYTPAETSALAGMVMNQAVTISSATLQRTLPKLSEEPTPMIAELTTCDVLTGSPK